MGLFSMFLVRAFALCGPTQFVRANSESQTNCYPGGVLWRPSTVLTALLGMLGKNASPTHLRGSSAGARCVQLAQWISRSIYLHPSPKCYQKSLARGLLTWSLEATWYLRTPNWRYSRICMNTRACVWFCVDANERQTWTINQKKKKTPQWWAKI